MKIAYKTLYISDRNNEFQVDKSSLKGRTLFGPTLYLFFSVFVMCIVCRFAYIFAVSHYHFLTILFNIMHVIYSSVSPYSAWFCASFRLRSKPFILTRSWSAKNTTALTLNSSSYPRRRSSNCTTSSLLYVVDYPVSINSWLWTVHSVMSTAR